MNRLKNEKSPYLLQHANNPVNWYPWGKEAFDKAKEEDKPLFISIGYSTCHWCHVMNEECFSDEKVAKLINEVFVPIKVDREERRDIDNIYILAAHIINNSSGGWPLTIFATPDKKPFFAATYIPKTTQGNQIGLMDIVPHIQYIWQEKKNTILKAAEQIVDILKKVDNVSKEDGHLIEEDIFDYTFESLYNIFDLRNGGFGKSPKFPIAHNINFLLKYFSKNKIEKSLGMALKTLDAIRLGGIYDHIGGGIHRYTTDEKWLIPHFEKTLYDQALMMDSYVSAYKVTNDNFYKETAEDIALYALEDLLSPDGAFFSGQDALSEYYLWEGKELIDIFGEKIREIINFEYEGNFSDEKTGNRTGKNVIFFNNKEKLNEFKKVRNRLKHIRKKRELPEVDKKILLDWNALMVTSLFKLNEIVDDNKFFEPAINTLNFLLEKMIVNNKLYHRLIDDSLNIEAFIDDYIFLIEALLTCYESTLDKFFLEKSVEIANYSIENFWDNEKGGYFFSNKSAEDLFLNKKEFVDSSIPSANSKAIKVFSKIYHFTNDERFLNFAYDLVKIYSHFIERTPSGFTEFLANYLEISNY